MATTSKKPKLLVIVGPTASGKSELAFRLAQKFNGEIIAADSRTIYKGMDIGTAKPSKNEQEQIPYWGIDLIEPGQTFSAAKFKDYAEDKIAEIQSNQKLPILVGGTGLYIDSVLFNFSFVERSSRLHRFVYKPWSVEKLQRQISQRGWQMPQNDQNKRHLIATLERRGKTGSKHTDLLKGTLLIGLMPPDDILRKRINLRAEQIFKDGIIGEAEDLIKKYGMRKVKRSSGIVYPIILKFTKGQITKAEAKDLFKKADWQYARRQKTWFRRNKFIQWYKSGDEAFTSVSHLLNKS